jgi:hypothetical protein
MLIVTATKDDIAAVGGHAAELNLPACKRCVRHETSDFSRGYVGQEVLGSDR